MLDRIRIVLVEPRHPGNIGSAARAMKTMGINQLVLVNPARFPDPPADWRAAGAMDVLDKAIVVDDVASAVADESRIDVALANRGARAWARAARVRLGPRDRDARGTPGQP